MKILLATDGSKFSKAAVEECKKYIGSGLATEIKIVSAYEAQVPIVAEPMAISSDCYQKLNEYAHDRSADCAREARDMLLDAAQDAGVEVTMAVEMSHPASFIVETAEQWHADLVIVGSHGRGFLGRLALGSISDAVVHAAPCSVLVVRSK